MRAKRIRFENVACFRGVHEVQLDPVVYGVEAERAGRPGSSNGIGKSTAIELFAIAEYGWHRYRTDDDLISHGADAWSVELEHDDGTVAKRVHRRGRSSVLTFDGAAGDAAQKRIVEAIGLTRDDFFSVAYFEQKQMARFIVARPADRLAIVAGWIELARLYDASTRVRDRTKDAELAAEMTSQNLARLDAMLDALVADYGVKAAQDLEAAIVHRGQEIEINVAAKRTTADTLVQRSQRFAIAERAQQDRDRLVKLRQQRSLLCVDAGVVVRAELLTKSREAAAEASLKKVAAERDYDAKRKLVAGTFDGECPITKSVCPARDDVERFCTGNAQMERIAKTAVQDADKTSRVADVARDTLQEKATKADRAKLALASIDEKIGALVEATKDQPELDEDEKAAVDQQLAMAQREIEDLASQRGRVQSDLQQAKKASASRALLVEQLARQRRDVQTHRDGGEVVKRSISVAAKDAIDEIEQGANDLLDVAGIELRIKIEWTPDRRNEKLDVTLTPRSGAYEDLAGIAVSLSASRWLRARRSSSWSVALVDEPFGALDDENRAALSAHFAQMLRHGFQQGLVVAHQRGSLAMPGRIKVVGGDRGSRLEIVR